MQHPAQMRMAAIKKPPVHRRHAVQRRFNFLPKLRCNANETAKWGN